MRISDLKNQFEYVDSVSVVRNKDGQVELKQPQRRYSRSTEKNLHPDGEGPFCEFDINTSEYEDIEGVFILTVDEVIKYVGESSNIGHYIYQIGKVSPSACYEGGQQTVCRVNTRIFYATRDGSQVSLWATESSNPNELKKQLVYECNPSWNLQ
jgi:hypothetical protein